MSTNTLHSDILILSAHCLYDGRDKTVPLQAQGLHFWDNVLSIASTSVFKLSSLQQSPK